MADLTCASSPTMPPPPARKRLPRSPRPIGSTPPMTAIAWSQRLERAPSPPCSSARSRRSGCRPAPPRTASRSPRSARRTAASSATATPISRTTNAARRNSTPAAPNCCSARGTARSSTRTAVDALLGTIRKDVHQVQPAALSITNASEYGCVYTPDETAALGDAAPRRAGFASTSTAPASPMRWRSLGCAPADLSWRAGVDALSFGFTKNGALAAEGPDLVRSGARRSDPSIAASAPAICSPRAAISPPRSWRCWRATSGCATPAPPMPRRPGSPRRRATARLVLPVEANEVFIRVTPDEAAALRAQGFDFYDWGPGEARLVTSWDSDLGRRRRARRGDPRAVTGSARLPRPADPPPLPPDHPDLELDLDRHQGPARRRCRRSGRSATAS